MCGISGYWGSDRRIAAQLAASLDTIGHRGPDDRGTHVANDVSMGMTRLSIIDLEGGSQPVYNTARREDLTAGSDFRRLYKQTMRRVDAIPLYFFGDDYYTELFQGLGSNLLVAEVRDRQGVPVSSALLMRHEQLLHYHLSGSNVDDARMGSNNLMIWTAAQFAIDQGLSQFHLGGGLDGRDSLFKFKSSFGGRELEYRVSGVVIDEDAYQAQVENRAKDCETTPEALLAAPYFPAYRGGTK